MKTAENNETEQSAIEAENYFPFVYSVVKRFAGRGLSKAELFQSGVVGLLEAARRFDPSRGVTFVSFAFPHIEGSIRNALRANSVNTKEICLNQIEVLEEKAKFDAGKFAVTEANLINGIEIRKSVSKLSMLESEIIKLRYFKELTQMRTAKLLNISQSTVSKKERKALEKIKKKIQDNCLNE